MTSDGSRRRAGPPGAAVTGALTLLLVICLVDCATGSCLSYGHSCWGAHGKRSAKPPAGAPDWFLDKFFQRLISNANSGIEQAGQASNKDDIRALYQDTAAIDAPSADRLGPDNEDFSLELAANRNPEAKPMLDEELLSKMKLWKIMRDVSLE